MPRLDSGGYALLLQRKIGHTPKGLKPNQPIAEAIKVLNTWRCLDFGDTQETDFFVIRLKDKYAAAALAAYAGAAMRDDPEWALEVLNLAKKAAEYPLPQIPD